MNAKNMPAVGADAWKLAVLELIHYAGFKSAEALAKSFKRPRLSGMGVRRIYDLDDTSLGKEEEWRLKLGRLSGMLELPVETLRLFFLGDSDGLRRLNFTRPQGEEIKQFLLDQLAARPAQRQRKRA